MRVVVCVFGVMGMQLFQGALLFRCYEEGSTEPLSRDKTCSDGGVVGGRGTCGVGQVCLLYGSNPYNGTVGYDHIGIALMTTFQVR